MALISPAYCTEADAQRLFSAAGVTSFADHDANGTSDSGVVDDCINQATEEISYYCQRYTPASLATSTLINRWATVLTVYFLCQRRGNDVPTSIVSEVERIMTRLEAIDAGHQIPGLALRADLSPGFSNLRIDRRYPFRKQRVEPNSSEAASELRQDKVPFTPVPYE